MDTYENLIQGFHKVSREERLDRLRRLCRLDTRELNVLSGIESPSVEMANHWIENAVGFFSIPLGVATYFRIDGRDLVIPMAVEETSIIAAASATAKWVRRHGAIRTYSLGRLIIGQIQIPRARNLARSVAILEANAAELIARANQVIPGLVARGGGVQELAFRALERPDGDAGATGQMLVVHVLCDPCDAMGANLINQVCETLKPHIEALTDESVGICILSNLVDGKLAGAEIILEGIRPEVARGIEEATLFAKADPYRAATHNKGVMNGIDPILIATGNDWRAVEAGVHAYASRSGRYQPITDWRAEDDRLIGRIEIPLAVGTVGGITRLHPTARVALKMLGVEHAADLARICAAVGLVQNLGALRALSTVGIVKGHMQLHATNLAIAAGAENHEVPQVHARLVEVLRIEKNINLTLAREILGEIRLAGQPLTESRLI